MVSPDELGEGESPQGMPFLGHRGDPLGAEEGTKQSSAQEGGAGLWLLRSSWASGMSSPMSDKETGDKERSLSKLLQ